MTATTLKWIVAGSLSTEPKLDVVTEKATREVTSAFAASVLSGRSSTMGAMRASPELLDLPYTHMTLPLVGAERFASLARDRGVELDRWRLEAVHRLGLLVPLFRVKRPVDEIRASFNRGDEHRAHVLARWEPVRRDDLLSAIEEKLLFDPEGERFRSRRSFAREIHGHKFDGFAYLYSQHQLACLGQVKSLLPLIVWRHRDDTVSARLKLDATMLSNSLVLARKLREAVIAIVALEPVYYSQIIGTVSTPHRFDLEAFLRWRFELGPRWLLDWLGIEGEWIRERAHDILGWAQRLDTLGGWSEVVGAGSSKRWSELTGTSRLVMDMRLGGERCSATTTVSSAKDLRRRCRVRRGRERPMTCDSSAADHLTRCSRNSDCRHIHNSY